MKKDEVCISCGMPLRSKDDYPLGDTSKDYCKYCAREDGSLKSFDEAVVGMAAFLERTQGLKGDAAKKAAFNYLIKMPAWKDKGK